MAPGWMQIALVILVIVLLFGRGRIADLMGDLAKGIKSFKSGLSDDDERDDRKETPQTPPPGLDHRPEPDADAAADIKSRKRKKAEINEKTKP